MACSHFHIITSSDLGAAAAAGLRSKGSDEFTLGLFNEYEINVSF